MADRLNWPFQTFDLHATRLNGDFFYPPHVHRYPQLYIIIDGEVIYRLENSSCRLKSGDAFLIPPGRSRSLRSACTSGMGLVAVFDADDPGFAVAARKFHLAPAQLEVAVKLAECIQNDAVPFAQRLVRFNYLCLELFSLDFSQVGEAKLPYRNLELEVRRIVGIAEKLMESNLSPVLSLDSLSRLSGVSKAGLGRYFHRIHQNSPMAHYRRIRLRAALRMLRDGYSISEVAFLTGFSSSQHFASAFRHEFGLAPSKI